MGRFNTMRHPLDAVESALVDASNALQDADGIFPYQWGDIEYIDHAIDVALRLVQAQIRADLDPSDPRD